MPRRDRSLTGKKDDDLPAGVRKCVECGTKTFMPHNTRCCVRCSPDLQYGATKAQVENEAKAWEALVDERRRRPYYDRFREYRVKGALYDDNAVWRPSWERVGSGSVATDGSARAASRETAIRLAAAGLSEAPPVHRRPMSRGPEGAGRAAGDPMPRPSRHGFRAYPAARPAEERVEDAEED